MALLPQEFPSYQEVRPQADFTDIFSGVSYVKLYLWGGKKNGTNQFALTTNPDLPSDMENINSGTATLNFDLEDIEKPFTVLDKPLFVTFFSSGHLDVTFNLIYVSKDGTTITIGTGIADTNETLGQIKKRAFTFTPTRIQNFGRGDKLRLQAVIATNNSGFMYFDPIGRATTGEQAHANSSIAPTIDTIAFILLPVRIPI